MEAGKERRIRSKLYNWWPAT